MKAFATCSTRVILGTHTWHSTLQNSRAIFKDSLPAEQNLWYVLHCCKSTTLSLGYLKKKHTTGRDYWTGYKGHLKKEKKKYLQAMFSFQRNLKELSLFHPSSLKTNNSKGGGGLQRGPIAPCLQMSFPGRRVNQGTGGQLRALQSLLTCPGTYKHQGQGLWGTCLVS